LLFTYPTTDQKLLIPEVLIHGTTNIGVRLIRKNGIQSRGFNMFGKQKPPSSLDFGEGFYTTYNNQICRQQAVALAATRAAGYPTASPNIITISVHPDINQDSTLKCVYFDGGRNIDGLEWANFIVHHRVLKDKLKCISDICNGHPDIMIGPVADGNAISSYAMNVYNGKMSLEDFYESITQANWFPDYKQIVFGAGGIKFLRPVL
jgi:hypothetical protein